ncbi:MAG: hypothetical protein KKH61_07550, partial [Gammaproteobacteria bacterium]|nr:hypothetical protein [Gammaproteobacteria bacterium]
MFTSQTFVLYTPKVRPGKQPRSILRRIRYARLIAFYWPLAMQQRRTAAAPDIPRHFHALTRVGIERVTDFIVFRLWPLPPSARLTSAHLYPSELKRPAASDFGEV